MKTVCAIDVAKNKSMILLINEFGEILIGPYEIKHNIVDFNLLNNKIKSFSIDDLTIFMESTSTYHKPVQRYFISNHYNVNVINPIHSKNNSRNLRLTKTDKQDCFNLADLFFKSNIKNNNSNIDDLYSNLNSLSRQYYHLTENIVRIKNRYIQLVNLTFPELALCFKDRSLYGITSLNFIKEFPHADIVKNKRIDALAHNLYNTSCLGISYDRCLIKAKMIKDLAINSYPGIDSNSEDVINLLEIIDIIIFNQHKLDICKEKMIALARQSFLFPIINSIFGIGELSASLLISELRDVTRFDNVKQLNAFCGLDPTIIQSGNSINYHGPISKRGNRQARKILFNCCQNIITSSASHNQNNSIYQYFRKKQSEGKHYYECITACSTKLLRIILALCKSNSLFQ
ncbi:MAG: IS110 family transposase [Bacilli bacterium]